MFSIGEDWISFFKINESENNFIKNLYHHGLFFYIIRFKDQMKIY